MHIEEEKRNAGESYMDVFYRVNLEPPHLAHFLCTVVEFSHSPDGASAPRPRP